MKGLWKDVTVGLSYLSAQICHNIDEDGVAYILELEIAHLCKLRDGIMRYL